MFHDGFFMGSMWFVWIFWIIVIGLIAYLIIRFTNQINNNRGIHSDEKPLDILKKRYARGEISKEEFDKIRKDIE